MPGPKTYTTCLMLVEGRTTFGTLQTCLGQLKHTAFVIPLARHFLSRLRDRVEVKRHKWHSITLFNEEIHDIRPWVRFLNTAHGGLSLNRITIR
jgi:hypothetical protein